MKPYIPNDRLITRWMSSADRYRLDSKIAELHRTEVGHLLCSPTIALLHSYFCFHWLPLRIDINGERAILLSMNAERSPRRDDSEDAKTH